MRGLAKYSDTPQWLGPPPEGSELNHWKRALKNDRSSERDIDRHNPVTPEPKSHVRYRLLVRWLVRLFLSLLQKFLLSLAFVFSADVQQLYGVRLCDRTTDHYATKHEVRRTASYSVPI